MRIKRSVNALKKRRAILKQAKGYFGSKHRLYKTAKEYHSDIDGFGKHAVKYFLTMQEWNDYNWLDNYKNSTFNVTVDSTLKSGYTFL